jgi:integrase/recombinase XerD
MKQTKQDYYNQKIKDILENKVGVCYNKKHNQLKGILTKKQIDTLSKWYNHLGSNSKAKSASTFYDYLKNIRKFALFQKKNFEDITKEDIDKYINFIRINTPNSARGQKLIVKMFFNWLNPKIVEHIKLESKKFNKIDYEETIHLTEIKEMIEKATTPQEKAIIITMFESGCRASELLDLNVHDLNIDENGSSIRVDGKTGKRKMGLILSSPYLQEHMNNHVNKGEPTTPLFFSTSHIHYGGRLSHSGLRYLLARAVKRIGLKKRCNPHWFRHSGLTFVYSQGFNEAEMRIWAGWSDDSSMTKVYIHIGEREVNDKYSVLMGHKVPEKNVSVDILKPITCPRCKKNNPGDSKYCNCGMLLSYGELNKVSDKFIEKVKETALVWDNRVTDDDEIYELVMNNPTLKNAFKKIIGEHKELIELGRYKNNEQNIRVPIG